jgi:hypothetical protein
VQGLQIGGTSQGKAGYPSLYGAQREHRSYFTLAVKGGRTDAKGIRGGVARGA